LGELKVRHHSHIGRIAELFLLGKGELVRGACPCLQQVTIHKLKAIGSQRNLFFSGVSRAGGGMRVLSFLVRSR